MSNSLAGPTESTLENGPEFNNDFCSNRGKQSSSFWKSMGGAILGITGFGGVYDHFVPSEFSKFKSDIQSVQNATQQFINQSTFAFAKTSLALDEQIIAHSDLNSLLNQNIISVNDEILQEQITMNSMYIFVLYVVFIIIYIYIYIKV